MKKKPSESPEAKKYHPIEHDAVADLTCESLWERVEAVIEGLDQEICQKAWARLKEHPRAVDQTFIHDGKRIYCARDIDPTIKKPHISIGIEEPENEFLETPFELIKDKKSFIVKHTVYENAGGTKLTNKEIESILNGIIHGEIVDDKS